MTEEQEIQAIKESKKWTVKAFAAVFGFVVAFIGIIGLLFGKIVEATLFEEITKWVVMAVIIGAIVCIICYVPITMLSDARRKLYPEHGKGWFKQALKIAFGKK